MLRLKEQTLGKAQYELKTQTAAMQMLESKIVESEALNQSTRQELSARNDRLQALQEELAIRTQRLTILEAEEASVRRRASEYDAAAAIQAEVVRQFQLARQDAEQALESQRARTARPSASRRRVGSRHRRSRSATRARGGTRTGPRTGPLAWKCNSAIETPSIETALHQLNKPIGRPGATNRRTGAAHPTASRSKKRH